MIKLVGKSDLSSSHQAVICHRIWLYVETLLFPNIKVPLIFCFRGSRNETGIFLLVWRTEIHTCQCVIWLLTLTHFAISSLLRAYFVVIKTVIQVINTCTWCIQLTIKQNSKYELWSYTWNITCSLKKNAETHIFIYVPVYLLKNKAHNSRPSCWNESGLFHLIIVRCK